MPKTVIVGCDIHLGVEVRNPKTGQWATWSDGKTPCTHCGGEHYRYDDGDDYECEHCDKPFRYTTGIYHRNRNYFLFAVLAGVRDHLGMIVPITVPRGQPEDMDPRTKFFLDDPDDGHSDSWCTVAELQAYDLDQTFQDKCYVPLADYTSWSDRSKPPANAEQFIRCHRIVTEEAYKKFLASLPLDESGRPPCELAGRAAARLGMPETPTHVEVEAPVTYRGELGDFYTEFVPRIAKLGAPEDVRIVFNFDN